MQNALHRGKVGLLGVMYVKSNLLDGIGDVGVGECRVLEGTSEAHVLSQISNKRLRLDRHLGLCAHEC
jgi:hypothetical protein